MSNVNLYSSFLLRQCWCMILHGRWRFVALIRVSYENSCSLHSIHPLTLFNPVCSNGDEIEFYIQLQRLTNVTSSHVDVTVELHRIVYTRTDDVTRSVVVHRHRVSDVTYLRYLLVQLGGIGYCDSYNVLCWAPVDSVLCAQLSRSKGRLKDVQTVVNTAQVEEICQGYTNFHYCWKPYYH